MAPGCFESRLQLKKAVNRGRITVDGVAATSPAQLLTDGAAVDCRPASFVVHPPSTAAAHHVTVRGAGPAPLWEAVVAAADGAVSATALNRALKRCAPWCMGARWARG